jgi:hypothetical protein
MDAAPTAVEVFCSYANADETWRQKLETHLSLLRRQGLVSLWHNRLITPGTDWAKTIDTHLETASVILLLVSADFFASDYCYGIEMKRALERHEAREARVIPLLVRPVDWKNASFAQLHPLPTDARPLSTWQDEDAALTNVVAGIRLAIEDLLTARTALPAIWSIPTMSRKRSPVPKQAPNQGSALILWMGMGFFLAALILGIYAIMAKQNIIFLVLSFVLAMLALPIGILQIAPNLLPQAWQLRKTGLLVVETALLIGLLIMNVSWFIRPWVPHPPVSTSIRTTVSSTSLSVTDCGKTIDSNPPDQGGPPYTQLNPLFIRTGCVGILDAYQGNVDNGQQQWDQDGGLIALPAGNYNVIFTNGSLYFSPSLNANATFCQLYHDEVSGGHPLQRVRPLSDWHPC